MTGTSRPSPSTAHSTQRSSTSATAASASVRASAAAASWSAPVGQAEADAVAVAALLAGEHRVVGLPGPVVRRHQQIPDREVKVHPLAARLGRADEHAGQPLPERQAAQVEQQRLAVADGQRADVGRGDRLVGAEPAEAAGQQRRRPGGGRGGRQVGQVRLVGAGERPEGGRALQAPILGEPAGQDDLDGVHQNVGSSGGTKSTSRSQPSFSSLIVWIAMALALASRSGSAWYSETQQR